MVVAVSAGVLIVAATGVAVARNRQQPPDPQALASVPAGGVATSPGAGSTPAASSSTPSSTTLAPAVTSVYRGTMVRRDIPIANSGTGEKGSVGKYKAEAWIECKAGACSLIVGGYAWPRDVTVNAGDGSPGTYRTSYPAVSNSARCRSLNVRDAFSASVTVAASTLQLTATAPGFDMIRCSSTRRLGRWGATWSFTGTLVP